MLNPRTYGVLMVLLLTLVLQAGAQAPSAQPAEMQEVYRVHWTMQDIPRGLEQPIAQTVIERANDWMTRSNPNVATARLDDRVQVETVTEFAPSLGTLYTRLDKLILGTIILDDEFGQFLDEPTVAQILRRDCFWCDETVTVLNPALSPITPALAELLSKPFSLKVAPRNPVGSSISEWTLNDHNMQTRITASLSRYYGVIRRDSSRVRYLITNAGRIPYRLRTGKMNSGDTIEQIISISIGRVILSSPGAVRIALGDNACAELLNTRGTNLTELTSPQNGTGFGHDDWSGGYTFLGSLDRIDYRITPTFGVFGAMGSPESNLRWWNDATARIGCNTPDWEAAVLLPLASGNSPVGLLHERLLLPVYGGTVEGTFGRFHGRVRVAHSAQDVLSASAPTPFVHTIGAQADYWWTALSSAGEFRFTIGAGYEQFENTNSAEANIHRFAPVAGLQWTPSGGLFRLSFGTADMALCAGLSARLTEHLWLEADLTNTTLLRRRQIFEHPFSIFITPLLKF